MSLSKPAWACFRERGCAFFQDQVLLCILLKQGETYWFQHHQFWFIYFNQSCQLLFHFLLNQWKTSSRVFFHQKCTVAAAKELHVTLNCPNLLLSLRLCVPKVHYLLLSLDLVHFKQLLPSIPLCSPFTFHLLYIKGVPDYWLGQKVYRNKSRRKKLLNKVPCAVIASTLYRKMPSDTNRVYSHR